MVKIFIDPGHGGSDPGATGNGLQEKNITLQIAQRIRDMLTSEYENVSVKMSRTGDQTVSLNERTKAANDWNADFYLSIHINAGGGTGFESYVHPQSPQRTKNLQNTIHDEIMKQVDFRNRGKKQANFHVLRETVMDAMLTENGFIDNSADANKLKKSSFIDNLARGHVNGLAKSLNLKKKSSPPPQDPPKNNPGQLYKVQIGAFRDEENAKQLADRAKKAGFDVYIVKE
ncbi:N-acetylmuramoyl-L-alanine amidase [Bacillus kwashiorkori]|uniref:N-acetylmuramoyl-L-alanine amidase n=1 Tax=Bacillus kwashiorkori TaxID=1522318 RepID=UPI00078021A9|nr:N-acetylmuramoyl-L-alanine amidase [Bacillus kwashiorkori]